MSEGYDLPIHNLIFLTTCAGRGTLTFRIKFPKNRCLKCLWATQRVRVNRKVSRVNGEVLERNLRGI